MPKGPQALDILPTVPNEEVSCQKQLSLGKHQELQSPVSCAVLINLHTTFMT